MQEIILKSIEKSIPKSNRLIIRDNSKPYHWQVSMPYRLKFNESELEYLKKYGLEDFLDWQFSIFEEDTWRSIRKAVRRLLPKSIDIDDYDLHDNYIFECVECVQPDYLEMYEKRFKKLGLIA